MQDDEQSRDTIRKALELGVTHFDTAQAYGRGHGEEILGETLPKDRTGFLIATKLPFTFAHRVETALNFSLKRLRCEVIDLVYIHWPKRGADLAGMMEGLEAARQKGIIRYIGVSNFSVQEMRQVMNAGRVDAHQIGYSLLWKKPEREVLPFCREKSIEVITYGSLAEGILTGKFGPAVRFPQGDHRQRTILFDQLVWPAVYKAVEEMKSVAYEAGVTLAACAVQWLLSRPGVTSVLAGARTPEQVAQNAALFSRQVDRRLIDAVAMISDRLSPALPDEGNVFRWYP